MQRGDTAAAVAQDSLVAASPSDKKQQWLQKVNFGVRDSAWAIHCSKVTLHLSKETFWLNTNSTINITKKWRISYSARFDLMKNDLINHRFSIYRDLHCWELALDWTPSGYANGFYLRIQC